MGDTGDDFKAFRQMKNDRRRSLELSRITYALRKISDLTGNIDDKGDHFVVRLAQGTITFWSYTGWFCGQRPLGNIKGRGINNLLHAIKSCQLQTTGGAV